MSPREADSDLGLGLEIEPLVTDLNTGLRAWCEDYVERYGAHVGLYGRRNRPRRATGNSAGLRRLIHEFAEGAMADPQQHT